MPPTRKKAQRNDNKLRSAVITISDKASMRWRDGGIPANIARNLGYTAVCAAINSQSLASVPVRLMRKTRSKSKMSRGLRRWVSEARGAGWKSAMYAQQADDFDEVKDHEAVEILRDPNPSQQGFDFWELFHRQGELCGNSFLHPVLDPAGIQLHIMYPQWMRIEPGGDGMVKTYWYGKDRASEQAFEPDEVKHKQFALSPHSPYWGLGPLQGMVLSHDIRATMDQYELAFFDNMARPDYHVNFENGVNADEIQRVEDKLRAKLGGLNNVGKYLVTAGVKITPLGWALKDLNHIEGRKKMESDIAAAFGVPESMIRLNDANLASAQTGYETYCRMTVLPRARKHAEWLTEFILPIFGLTPGEYWYVCDNPVPEDNSVLIQNSRDDVASGVVTVNEARMVRGLEPIEGGDDLRVNGVPLGILSMPPPAPVPFGGSTNEEVAKPEQAEEREPEADAEESDDTGGEKAAGQVYDSSRVQPCVCGGGSKDGARQVSVSSLWMTGKVRLPFDPYDNPSLARKYRAVMLEQRDAFIHAMESRPSGYDKGAPVTVTKEAINPEVQRLLHLWGITSYDEWVEKYRAMTQAPVDKMVVDSASAATRLISRYTGDEYPVVVEEVHATKWAKENTAEYLAGLRSINETTAQRIADALSEGIAEGEGIAKLTGRVRGVFDGETAEGETISAYRARTIAQTETARAQTNGTLAGWKLTGVVRGKQWLLSPTACEFCEAVAKEYENRTLDLEQTFYPRGHTITGTQGSTMTLDYSDISGAPLHPNCHCSVIPVMVGEE